MTITTKIMISGFLFLLTIASGFWLNKSGKPLNTAIFNVHKLIALAGVILLGMVIYILIKNVEINIQILSLVICSALSVITLFVSGALLSIEKPIWDFLLIVHNVSMIITLVTSATTVYFLFK